MQPYKLANAQNILRVEDGAYIPMDEGNSDYQAYQLWCNAGGIPDPADPEPAPVEAPKPTLADLQAQLAALTAQIPALLEQIKALG